jgi:hypothetical protein
MLPFLAGPAERAAQDLLHLGTEDMQLGALLREQARTVLLFPLCGTVKLLSRPVTEFWLNAHN